MYQLRVPILKTTRKYVTKRNETKRNEMDRIIRVRVQTFYHEIASSCVMSTFKFFGVKLIRNKSYIVLIMSRSYQLCLNVRTYSFLLVLICGYYDENIVIVYVGLYLSVSCSCYTISYHVVFVSLFFLSVSAVSKTRIATSNISVCSLKVLILFYLMHDKQSHFLRKRITCKC